MSDRLGVLREGQSALQIHRMDAAIKHFTAGTGIWEEASNDKGGEACSEDIPTLEILARWTFCACRFPI